jgi:response regulator of citrate/malate metabolism
MREKQDQWSKPRGNGNHFTAAEVEVIKGAFEADLTAKKVAQALKCSSRSVRRYFEKLRDGMPISADTRKPTLVVQIKRGPVDRRYHGSFEL